MRALRDRRVHGLLWVAVAGLLTTAVTATTIVSPPSAPLVAGRVEPGAASSAVGGGVSSFPPTAASPAPSAPSTSSAAPVRPPLTRVSTTPKSPPAATVVRRPPPRPNRSTPTPASSGGGTAVHYADTPDPAVLFAAGAYWAFATQSGTTQVQVLRSTDLRRWEQQGDALAHLPAWAAWGWVWAPAALERPSGFVLYYTTRHAATGLQCISLAAAPLPQGPYLDTSTEPLVCQMDRGGSIDPQPFVDEDGSVWLLWKSEGTIDGEPTRLWVQRLSDDGLRLVGTPTVLLTTAEAWEQPIIEGPAMVKLDGRYHLLFAGNRWETSDYSVGHAVCDTVGGPCRRVSRAPVLSSAGEERGPGSPAPFRTAAGQLVLGYHAWGDSVGYPSGARRLHLAGLSFDGERLVLARPWTPSGIGSVG